MVVHPTVTLANTGGSETCASLKVVAKPELQRHGNKVGLVMNAPERMPEAVKEAVNCWARAHPRMAQLPNSDEQTVLPFPPKLSWDSLNGNYFFWAFGMYHGVELDGTVHT